MVIPDQSQRVAWFRVGSYIESGPINLRPPEEAAKCVILSIAVVPCRRLSYSSSCS